MGKIGTGRGRHSVATRAEIVAGDDHRVDDHGVGVVGKVLTASGRARLQVGVAKSVGGGTVPTTDDVAQGGAKRRATSV